MTDGDKTEAIVSHLMKEVSRVYAETGTLTDDVLSALSFVLQGPLQQALELVDRRSVTRVEAAPSGRKAYKVTGSTGLPYTCLTSSLYCGCPAYKFTVLKKAEALMCKHVMAVKLCEAMDTCKHEEITDQQMADMLANLD